MNKKTFSTIGMVISILLVLLGLLTMCGAFGGDSYYYSTAPYTYDSGYASFGGDYYTFSVNNAAEATDAAQAASANARELVEFVRAFCGLFMMGFGAIAFCGFGIIFASCKNNIAINPVPEETIEESTEILDQCDNSVDNTIPEDSPEAEPVESNVEEISE